MWTLRQYRQIVRASAAYDLIVTAPFATPWTFALVHQGLVWLDTTLGLPGHMPAFDPIHILMANLLGSVVCVWSVLRLRSPQRRYGRYDAYARALFSAWQIYALAHGASAIIVVFLVIEMAFGLAQALPVTTRQRYMPGLVSS
ncbi:hypothetical protein [Chitinimonas sp. BJYL2]|uniref:hypothetical protein n=1 Tax=Chitinimonas sp. BJYL2 TaxID=2976696 RepID=UPI0022B49B3B|nr:hypothetical protein [Chitinimonas sp. BJYL2]